MTTPRNSLAFWNTVQECLEIFFEVDRARAHAIGKSYRFDLYRKEAEMRRPFMDLVYHAQPIHIASNLIGREVAYNDHFYDRYQTIEQKNLRLSRKRNKSVSMQLEAFQLERGVALEPILIPALRMEPKFAIAERPVAQQKKLVQTR